MPSSPHLRARLLRAVATLLFAAATTAQGTYYVNGLTGTDSPAAGSSASTPWKTITYAFAQIPPQTPSTSALLYVEGDQTYATQTNGESFPITPRYNVWVEGTFLGHGVLPILDPGAGGTALQLAGDESYFRNTVTYRYLDFRGGDYGIRMGSDPGHRHRPRVQDCVFRNQGAAGIAIEPNGTDADDPRFFQNRFECCASGILAKTDVVDERISPDVEECSFRNCGSGVVLTTESPGQTPSGSQIESINAQVRSCDFEQCAQAIWNQYAADHSGWHELMISRCRIAHCSYGLRCWLTISGWYTSVVPHQLDIRSCVFHECDHGIHYCTFHLGFMGNAWQCQFDVSHTSFSQCDTAAEYNLIHSAFEGTWDNVVITQCQKGLELRGSGDGVTRFDGANARIDLCDIGIDSYIWTEYGSYLSLASTQISNASNCAIRHEGYPGNLQPYSYGTPAFLKLDGTTVADSPLGLDMRAPWSAAQINDTVFAGNTQDVQLAANVSLSVDHSCFQASSWPGVGNLNLTDPLLVRPFYKLAPTSPCIDAGANSGQVTTDYEGDPRASVSVQGGQALPDIGADEYVYAGSARPYGVGGFGPFNIFPEISSPNASVRIGQPLQVDLTGAIMPVFQVHAFAALLSLGFTESPGALPFDLASLGMPGSYLWNDAAAFFAPATVDSSGAATITWTLPNSTPLVGTTFTHQWFAVMPNPWGIISSDGLRVTVGQ